MTNKKRFRVLILFLGCIFFEHQLDISICSGEIIFEGTNNEFEWALPEGWAIFSGLDARKKLSSVPSPVEVPTNTQHLLIHPKGKFLSSIILRVEDKRFDYYNADLEELKNFMQDLHKKSGDGQIIKNVHLLNRSDGQKVLEVITQHSDSNAKVSSILVHAETGQIQAIFSSSVDAFSEDWGVFMSLIERIPFRIYLPKKTLIDSPKWYGSLANMAIGAAIGLLILNKLKKKRIRNN